MTLIGIDPGMNTGATEYRDGALVALATIRPHRIGAMLEAVKPALVVFEDSRLQSHVWTRAKTHAAVAKIGRNVGMVDAWCHLIEAECARLEIECIGVSPKDKGGKLAAEAFATVTGWAGRTNEHERDSAMVAWPYRRALHVQK